jgi:hypothetical protein
MCMRSRRPRQPTPSAEVPGLRWVGIRRRSTSYGGRGSAGATLPPPLSPPEAGKAMADEMADKMEDEAPRQATRPTTDEDGG